MCYSAESSLSTFLVGSTSSLYLLLFSNSPIYKHAGLFFISVAFIQLLEYLMWTDQKCGIINDTVSRLIVPVLSLQPIAIFLGGYIFNTTVLNKNTLYYILLLLTIGLAHALYKKFSDKRSYCSKPNIDGALAWAYMEEHDFNSISTMLYYIIFLIAPFMLKDKVKGMIILAAGLSTYLYSRFPQISSHNSRWCFFSSYLPILFVILNELGI